MNPTQYKALLSEPHMQKRVISKTKMGSVFGALFVMFEEQNPLDERPRVATMNALLATWHRGITQREWLALARQRLGLELIVENFRFRARKFKVGAPEIGAARMTVEEATMEDE